MLVARGTTERGWQGPMHRRPTICTSRKSACLCADFAALVLKIGTTYPPPPNKAS